MVMRRLWSPRTLIMTVGRVALIGKVTLLAVLAHRRTG